MADVASKQETTALFLSTIVTRTRRHTEPTKKTDKPNTKTVLCCAVLCCAVLCCAREHSVQFFVLFLFNTVTLSS